MAKQFWQLGFALLLVSVIFLCYFIAHYFMVYHKYRHVKAGTCSTVSSHYTGEQIECSCGRKCKAKHSCLVIKVTLDPNTVPAQDYAAPEKWYSWSDQRGGGSPVTLYENEQALSRQQCSFYPDCTWPKEIRHDLDTHMKQYGQQNSKFKCYFDQNHPYKVIRVTTNSSLFVHFFLWPCLGIFAGVSVIGLQVYLNRSDGQSNDKGGCQNLKLQCCQKDSKDSENTIGLTEDNCATISMDDIIPNNNEGGYGTTYLNGKGSHINDIPKSREAFSDEGYSSTYLNGKSNINGIAINGDRCSSAKHEENVSSACIVHICTEYCHVPCHS